MCLNDHFGEHYETNKCTVFPCRMTVHSGMLSEVLSDWGLLELLLGELRRRAKILRKAGVASSAQIGQQRRLF